MHGGPHFYVNNSVFRNARQVNHLKAKGEQ